MVKQNSYRPSQVDRSLVVRIIIQVHAAVVKFWKMPYFRPHGMNLTKLAMRI